MTFQHARFRAVLLPYSVTLATMYSTLPYTTRVCQRAARAPQARAEQSSPARGGQKRNQATRHVFPRPTVRARERFGHDAHDAYDALALYRALKSTKEPISYVRHLR